MGWTKGHELKYWNKNGLKKGSYIYDNYRKAFNMNSYDLKGKIIADIGCGPFGGVLANLHNDIKLIPMDILADEYNNMHRSPISILKGDLSRKLSIEDEKCNFVICTNAIDHIPDIMHGLNELFRILARGGILFLHVHLRRKDQLNKAHVHSLDDKKISSKMRSCNFHIVQMTKEWDWVNDNRNRMAAYITDSKLL